MNYTALASQYKDTLLKQVIPFWEKHSPDHQFGGYFTCLDREGTVYDTDKFIWLQCRQVWTFSMLYNRLEKRENWLQLAKHGADFLRKFGMDKEGNWYFSLNREGKPLVQPYNIFSDCFAAMAFAQYGLTCNDEQAIELAVRTYRNILKRQDNPKGLYNKAYPETRPLKNFALPMILCNLSLELEEVLSKEEVNQTIGNCIHEVMTIFWDEESQLIFENVLPDSSHSDSFEGRLINPGHGIEAMWFLMDIAQQRNDRILLEKCIDITLALLRFGWDEGHGGIFYFLDAQGHPPQQLEWDQKLWWVHLEALVALAKGISLTKRNDCIEWYQKVHEYTWQHFPDPEHGEWFGYLRRDGSKLLPLKGGKWKGCFHVPRALWLVWKAFESRKKVEIIP